MKKIDNKWAQMIKKKVTWIFKYNIVERNNRQISLHVFNDVYG